MLCVDKNWKQLLAKQILCVYVVYTVYVYISIQNILSQYSYVTLLLNKYYSHDYCHDIELFNTVTEQTLYSHDYCHNIELFNTVTEQRL